MLCRPLSGPCGQKAHAARGGYTCKSRAVAVPIAGPTRRPFMLLMFVARDRIARAILRGMTRTPPFLRVVTTQHYIRLYSGKANPIQYMENQGRSLQLRQRHQAFPAAFTISSLTGHEGRVSRARAARTGSPSQRKIVLHSL